MSCNTACLLDYDNAPCIPISAFTDTSIEANVFFEEPVDLSAGTFSLTISKDERGDCPVLTTDDITVAADTETIDGETVNGYRVIILIPKTHGLVFGTYYGQVRNDVDAERAAIILKLTIQIQSSIARLP